MNKTLFYKQRLVVKLETIYMIFSIMLFAYFVVASFEVFGDVKDRANYYRSFDNLNNYSNPLQLLSGSSILYGIFFVFGNSFLALSIFAIIFLTLKLILLKKIFHSWAFILLYMVKFAFVIDLILLKESLALLLILYAYHSRKKILNYLYIFLAFLSHLSISLLLLLRMSKLVIFLVFSIFIVFTVIGSSEISLVYYYLNKLNFYSVDGESFIYQNPIFWMSTILLLWSLAHLIKTSKYRLRVLLIQIAVFAIGLLHPLIGIPAFRMWQVGSFIDLFALKYLNSKLLFTIYLLLNSLFLVYGTIYLKGYLD